MLSRQYAFRVLHQVSIRRSLSTIVNDSLADGAGGAAADSPSVVGPVRLGRVLQEALKATSPKYTWTKDEIREIYNTPLLELAHHSVRIHQDVPGGGGGGILH